MFDRILYDFFAHDGFEFAFLKTEAYRKFRVLATPTGHTSEVVVLNRTTKYGQVQWNRIHIPSVIKTYEEALSAFPDAAGCLFNRELVAQHALFKERSYYSDKR